MELAYVRNPLNPRVFFDITIDKESVGKIIMELFHDITPKSASNFKALCTGENGIGKIYKKALHLKGTQFHRIVPNYMAQGGDVVNQNGTSGECIWGEQFPDENFVRKHIGFGIMSYANKGRNTNASQFFYSLRECPWLDGLYVVFGQVLEGFDVLETMMKRAGSISGQTKQRVVIADCGVWNSN